MTPTQGSPHSDSTLQRGQLVVISTLSVPAAGASALEEAFTQRLHAVDRWDTHLGLQVWRDLHHPGHYAMASWWTDPHSFAAYMRSDDHHRSHARVPDGQNRPTLQSVNRYEVIST